MKHAGISNRQTAEEELPDHQELPPADTCATAGESMNTPEPDRESDELGGSVDLRPLWRWTNGDRVLTVTIRVQSKTCAELWFSEERPGQPPSLTRETFEKPVECEQFLMTKKAELEATGWRKSRDESG